MKSSLVLLAVLVSSTSFAASVECNGNQEAQFLSAQIGSVTHTLTSQNIQKTTFTLTNFRDYRENSFCSLDESFAEGAKIVLDGVVQLKSGDSVPGGILVYNPKTQTFTIE